MHTALLCLVYSSNFPLCTIAARGQQNANQEVAKSEREDAVLKSGLKYVTGVQIKP